MENYKDTDWLEGVDLTAIIHRVIDNSYVVTRHGMPFHVPNNAEFEGFYSQLHAYALEHPEVVTEEFPYEPTLDDLKREKLEALNDAFSIVEKGTYITSSLGFKADANTTANTNIEGLIKSMEALGLANTIFCDYDNVYHNVTLDDLKTLQLEVIQNGQSLYAQKWTIRDAIHIATSKEALDAIIIEFVMMDFSKESN